MVSQSPSWEANRSSTWSIYGVIKQIATINQKLSGDNILDGRK